MIQAWFWIYFNQTFICLWPAILHAESMLHPSKQSVPDEHGCSQNDASDNITALKELQTAVTLLKELAATILGFYKSHLMLFEDESMKELKCDLCTRAELHWADDLGERLDSLASRYFIQVPLSHFYYASD